MKTSPAGLEDDDGIDLILSQVTQEVDSTFEKKQSTMNVRSKREKLKTASKVLEALNLQNCTNITLNFH